jgi:hypothetical protein
MKVTHTCAHRLTSQQLLQRFLILLVVSPRTRTPTEKLWVRNGRGPWRPARSASHVGWLRQE